MQFLIFNKKRMRIILFSLVISISIVGLSKNTKTTETMSWVGERKTIVLDAGHGYPDERCTK